MVNDVNKVLKFLSNYKTRKQIEKRFKMSNTESYHLIKWLLKAKLIEEINLPVEGRTNRLWYYRTLK